jgi:hypothetical protein
MSHKCSTEFDMIDIAQLAAITGGDGTGVEYTPTTPTRDGCGHLVQVHTMTRGSQPGYQFIVGGHDNGAMFTPGKCY